MPSPIWLLIGPTTAQKDLSKGEGWHCASRLRLKPQLSEGELSPSNFLRTPLTACSSVGVRGEICPLTRQSELWLSYRILWLQFLSQMWVRPVSLQRYIFPHTFSFWHFQSHLWTGIGPSRPRIVDRKITFSDPATIDFPYTSIPLILTWKSFRKETALQSLAPNPLVAPTVGHLSLPISRTSALSLSKSLT